MAEGLTLDTGALIAAEKRDRRLWSVLKEASARRATITVPAVVLAQAWRGNSPMIARLLPACVVEDFDELAAKRVGVLLSKSRRRPDVVDAAVVVGAGLRGDAIVTSDPDDIVRLVGESGVHLPIISV
jgi:predicted nucleic acid-binding protein